VAGVHVSTSACGSSRQTKVKAKKGRKMKLQSAVAVSGKMKAAPRWSKPKRLDFPRLAFLKR
jgi:hypothetical protein